MIKINLLESVTDRQSTTVKAVEKKASSPTTKLLLMVLAVSGLALLVTAYDVVDSHLKKSAAQKDFENQQQIAVQMEAIMKEQTDLENKIKSIDGRIAAIKRLRSTQAGPSAVLQALSERIASSPDIFLKSVEQKGDLLTIKGSSASETAITTFGKSLEFSSGLFTNLNIETKREDIPITTASDPNGGEPQKVENVEFTIRCSYQPSKALPNTQQANNGQPNAPAAPGTTPPAPAAPAAAVPSAPAAPNTQVAQTQNQPKQ